MRVGLSHLCVIFSCLPSILPITGVLSQDTAGCVSADSLLEGRRRIVSAEFRASNSRSGNRASQARLSDDGWCSRQLATDIFDPYIEIDFGGDVLISSIETQGVPPTLAERALFIGSRFIERYRVEAAVGENGNFQYITPSTMSFQPAIFPLGQSRISSTNRHRESLPRPVIGQTLRINPYEWNDEDHVCTRLEVYGCPLQECQSESSLNSDQYVDSVTVSSSSMNTDNLFNFGNTGRYCGPTDMRPFTMTITYSSPVLLREIGIQGRDRLFPWPNQYVTSFSLSFSEDDNNFTQYIQDTGSTEFTVSDHTRHDFVLWPPITASSIKITINDWSGQPCMSLLMVGCNYSDVVDHSIDSNDGTAIGIDSGLVEDMTIVLTTTESVTTTETIVQTTTESFTVTVTADLAGTPSPSPTQSSNTAASTSCSSDNDNTPIYVAVAIVIVGLLITIIVVVVGVLLCRRYQNEKGSNASASPLNVKYRSGNGVNSTHGVSIVEVENDLYGKEELRPQSQASLASAQDNENAQPTLYDSINSKPNLAEFETADNLQYGDTLKQTDTTTDTKSNENVYSYAIP